MKAMLLTAAPKNSEPVSPINTFAGYALYLKNPRIPPVSAAANIMRSLDHVNVAASPIKMSAKVTEFTKETPPAKPSKPSVRFTLFVSAMRKKILKGI